MIDTFPKYPFLKDSAAITEIRKHKWYESEKAGREIGFASAALDWAEKYGYAWLEEQKKKRIAPKLISDKRQYHRFNCKLPLYLKTNNSYIFSTTKDINIVGFSCIVPHYLPTDVNTEVTIDFHDERPLQKKKFQFKSRIERITPLNQKSSDLRHFIFAPFSREVRDYVGNHPEFVGNFTN